MWKRNRAVKTQKMERGGRNLVILGVVSTLIALTTTSVSLAIYHNSGDIYLDRSRPGFLPDEEEIEDESDKEEEKEYDFVRDGSVTKEGLEVFMENLQKEIDAVDSYKKPFSEEVLLNSRFGIPENEENVAE